MIMVTWKTRVGCDVDKTWFSGCDMIVVLLVIAYMIGALKL